MTASSLYEPEGSSSYVPGPLTAGPWSADAQHGGAVAALLGRAVERPAAEVPMQVVRLTVELMRPVPLRPMTVSASVTRPGKRVQLVEASVSVDGSVVAAARALRIRRAEMDMPASVSTLSVDPVVPPLPVDEGTVRGSPLRTAFAEAMDLRFVEGSWEALGPVKMWSRLRVPVVAGETPSPLQRCAAGADFGNGVSRVLDFETHIFINPDLTVALSREPVGEWIGFDAVSRISAQGFGQAESLIFDKDGVVGRSVQSLLVEKRS